ncbi:MAG: hypothetical protein BM563_08225 [Bacteroidetes bacterium MedPE-SWsnd-G1]|nr:MAG: hypothetical protein BM563_08225 [Bacteroidetes bacterium MedPE-SWsnd-G1]
MKKLLTLIMAVLIYGIGYSQTEQANDSLQGWTASGKITFLVNQTAFVNWDAGGDSNLSGSLKINYDFNYRKGPWLLDNKLLASYGINITEDDGLRKTDDRIELNSILGKDMRWENWYFSFFMNFKTQFTDGFDYEDDFLDQNENPGDPFYGYDNEDFRTSGAFAPGYLQFGPGLLWKKSERLNVNIAPFTSKLTFMVDEIFSYNDDDPDAVRYDSSNEYETNGVAPGDSLLYEFGLNIRAYYKTDIMKNVSFENILAIYSNYLDSPQNVDIDYTLNLVLTVNEWLSTDLTFQTIYDDNAYQGFQIRETFGLGVNLNF